MKSTTGPNHRRIPTPLRVRWLRFRHQLLPVVTVALCAALSAWLWARHAGSGTAVGEVAVDRFPVTSTVEGVLVELPGGAIKPHDRVNEGDEIARLDTAPIEARRAARQVEVERLRLELQSLESAPGRPAGAGPTANPNPDGSANGNAPANGANEDQLRSLRTTLAVREDELAQLNAALESLRDGITSPVSGTVFRVYLRPGQLARVGDPIMEISADGAAYVVSYLREEQQYIRPTQRMTVEMRPRSDPRRVVEGTVDTVGSTVEAVPARQLRDQRIPEWGLPVRLTLPDDANLRPGEMVYLAFKKPAP